MKICPFEELNITTMTMIASLSSSVLIQHAFNLLPITLVDIQKTRETSKCKLPHCKLPGAILSMRFRNETRGIIKNKSSPFKNAVTIDISTSKKNISVKLSANSLQMCGASSFEDGKEAVDHIVGHINRIQNLLNRVREDPEIGKKSFEWVIANTRGSSCNRIVKHQYKSVNGIIMNVSDQFQDYSITFPMVDPPPNLNIDIINMVLSASDGFIYHSDLCSKINYIYNLSNIIYEPLTVKKLSTAMVNYNYVLGFEVDRILLNEMMDGNNGFISRYNNALSSSVTIELPYEPEIDDTIKRRKNKVPHHTFLVYKSGAITQSGPGGEIMKNAYLLFMDCISKLQDCIQYIDPTPSSSFIDSPPRKIILNIIE